MIVGKKYEIIAILGTLVVYNHGVLAVAMNCTLPSQPSMSNNPFVEVCTSASEGYSYTGVKREFMDLHK